MSDGNIVTNIHNQYNELEPACDTSNGYQVVVGALYIDLRVSLPMHIPPDPLLYLYDQWM
jgi:hypothetical protein